MTGRNIPSLKRSIALSGDGSPNQTHIGLTR
nr:MAG TPA: hypothetical protein [Caudoviricetes sp.]